MRFGPEGASALAALAAGPDTSTDVLVKAVNDFLEDAPRASPETVAAAVNTLAPAFTDAHGESLVIIANVVGMLVERGADPGIAAEAFGDRLTGVAAGARALGDAARHEGRSAGADASADADDDEGSLEAARLRLSAVMPAEAAAWEVLDGLLGPALAICGASAAGRERAAMSLPDLDALAEDHMTAHWLRRFLRVLYDEPFVAIEPATGVAIRGRMSGISENFQLNVLLMDAFPRQGLFARPRVSKSVVAVATGDGPQQTTEAVTAAWDLMTWPAASGDGSLPRAGVPAFADRTIWNEGMPADIPAFEDMRVILLGPPSYVRSWTSQREFLNLRASLASVERLPKSEAIALLQRMAASPKPL
jgi:hypothetical protein